MFGESTRKRRWQRLRTDISLRPSADAGSEPYGISSPGRLGSMITLSTGGMGSRFPSSGACVPTLPQARSSRALAADTRTPAGWSVSFMIWAKVSIAASACWRARALSALMFAGTSVSFVFMGKTWRVGWHGSIGWRDDEQITRRLDRDH